MKLLVDLQHPAHLHFFRNVIQRLNAEGHQVRITGRNKDILVGLAESYNIRMQVFGTAREGLVNLGAELFYRQWRLYGIIKEFKPSAMMAVAGTYVSLLGRLMSIPTYVFYDTEHAALSNLLAYPFATCIYVPRCYRKNVKWRHQRYNSYHELAYLSPKYFTPDPAVLREVGLNEGEVFTIVRYVGWGAAHDVGLEGLTTEGRIEAVRELSRYGNVFVSCEGNLPGVLEPYRLRLNLARIHHLMAYAALVFGESATMASEGAVLGVPGIYVDPVGRGYTDEEEKEYGLVFNFTPAKQWEAIKKGCAILSNYSREGWKEKGTRLVGDKLDVTKMLYQIAMERPFSR